MVGPATINGGGEIAVPVIIEAGIRMIIVGGMAGRSLQQQAGIGYARYVFGGVQNPIKLRLVCRVLRVNDMQAVHGSLCATIRAYPIGKPERIGFHRPRNTQIGQTSGEKTFGQGSAQALGQGSPGYTVNKQG